MQAFSSYDQRFYVKCYVYFQIVKSIGLRGDQISRKCFLHVLNPFMGLGSHSQPLLAFSSTAVLPEKSPQFQPHHFENCSCGDVGMLNPNLRSKSANSFIGKTIMNE